MPETSAMPDAQSLRAQGTVFGFEVHSSFPLYSLRDGGGDRLEVVTPSLPGTRRGDQMVVEMRQPRFLARIYHDGDTYRMWVRGVGWFEIDPSVPRVSVPQGDGSVLREELLWGVPALVCFLHRGDLSLHAAAVEVDGEAILLVAPQGHGKSTLAAGFAQLGYRILSEDLTCVRVAGRPSVIPGPATLRLRNDVAPHVHVDFASRLDGGQDRARYALDVERRGDSSPVPIRGLLFLRRSEDEIQLEAVAPTQALPDLWQFSFRVSPAHERGCFERIVDLAAEVPIWNLFRPLRVEALAATARHVLAQL